jgi:MFS family permease
MDREPGAAPALAGSGPGGGPAGPRGWRGLLVSSAVGTVIEWYDFFAFASAAALVFDRAFFPKVAPLRGVMLALLTYAVGFASRPLGGVVFGVLGDRYGRKRALVASLLLMGLATVAIGLVPSYARIGPAAPALLVALRLCQGFAVGGEVGGAVLLVAESLDSRRRGRWTAWPQVGGPVGNLLSAGVLAVLVAGLSEARFAAWGWRVAFLLSGALVAVGIWMRARIEESPLYRALQGRRASAGKTALGATLAAHWRGVLTVLFVKAGENALFYLFTTFMVVYVTRVLHLPRGLALTATLVSSAVEVPVIFMAGAWSDRVGRRPVTAIGLLGAAVWAFALFPIMASRGAALITLAAVVGGVFHGLIVGGMSAFFVEQFPTAARYTGFSLGYQTASMLSGGVAPLVGVALLNAFGSTVPVSLYAAAMTLPALICLWRAKETRGLDLDTVT